jgi:predicted enzyme related to lactoylglutathione lyase
MKINGIDALYYFAHDFPRAKAFYTMMIGTSPLVNVEGSFCEWTLPNGEAFGVIKGAEYRQCNGALFNVDDVAAAVVELKAKGVRFNDDGDIEETPVCFMAFGNDSEGNGFVLHQRKETERTFA